MKIKRYDKASWMRSENLKNMASFAFLLLCQNNGYSITVPSFFQVGGFSWMHSWEPHKIAPLHNNSV